MRTRNIERSLSPLGIFVLVAALVAFFAAAGCAGTSGSATAANINSIEVGMPESQVLSIMGQPRNRETYGGTSFLMYTDSTGASIPVGVVNGRVTSIGRGAYDVVVRSQAQTATGSVRR